MKRFLVLIALSLVFGWSYALAGPNQGDLLGRLLAIADADQVQAYEDLNLTPQQLLQLRSAALEFLPRVEAAKSTPGGHFLLVPEAMRRVDGILTPSQRPLARKLIPRAHQWSKLRSLYQDYRSSSS